MSDEEDDLAASQQYHFPANEQKLSISDGEEAESQQFGGRSLVSPKMQKKKIIKSKRGRNFDSSRSLTDPNIKSLTGVTIESTSDSTPNVSECNPNLPPTGLSRSKSPRPSRTSKSPSSDQIFTDNPDMSNKINRPTYQQARSKFGSISSNNSFLASVSPSSSPFSLSVFRQAENQGKLSKDACTADASDRRASKLRLSSASSCQNQDQEASKSSQSPLTGPKSPFSKMKSFKDGFSSPESGRNKFLFYPNNATVSTKKQLARLRKHSTPSENFLLKFDADDPGESVPSPPGQTLEQAIQLSVAKRGLTMNTIEVYLDSSKTPLPMSSDSFLLANSTLWVKVKEVISKRSSTSSNSGSRKRHSSLTRFKKILTSLEDVRVSDGGESQQKVKVNHKGRLHSLLGSFSKQQDKSDQLNELLEQYSRNGLPKMPDLLTLGRPVYDKEGFRLEKHWTVVVSDEHSQTLGKHGRDQQEALWELMVTEVEYIEKLQVITDLFVCCLINLQNDLILNEIEVDKLCSNVVDVYYASCYFWTSYLSKVLQQARDSKAPLDPSLLKEGFLEFDKIFEPYKKYCLEQEVCRDYIKNKLKENELFRIFIQWAESQPQCKRLKLTDLIISPFQRLTRYKLLLYAIQRPIVRHLKALPLPSEDGTDMSLDQSWPRCLEEKQDIDDMVEQVEKFVNQVNVAMRMSQDHQQLSQIVDKIEAYEIVEPPNEECAKLIQKFSHLDLTMPMHGCASYESRCLVLEGSLKLKDSNTKCDVQCYLFTDMFMITRSTFKKSDKVRFKVIKPLMRLDKIVTYELKDGGCFMVLHLNEFHLVQNVLFLSGDSKLWMEAITKAQKEYKEKRRSFSRKSDLSHVLDPQSSLCDEPTYFRPLTFDTISCASKASDASRRSVSVNEGLMKQEGVADGLSPTSSLPPLSIINFRGDDDDDDDGGMFSSIIKFAAKRSVSQQTSEGLERRSRPQNQGHKVKDEEDPSLVTSPELATDDDDDVVRHRRNKSVDTAASILVSSLQGRSRSSNEITSSCDQLLQTHGLEAAERLSCTSMSKSMPNVLKDESANEYDDDDDDDADEQAFERNRRAFIACDDANHNNVDDDDDVSVFSCSFRTKEEHLDLR